MVINYLVTVTLIYQPMKAKVFYWTQKEDLPFGYGINNNCPVVLAHGCLEANHLLYIYALPALEYPSQLKVRPAYVSLKGRSHRIKHATFCTDLASVMVRFTLYVRISFPWLSFWLHLFTCNPSSSQMWQGFRYSYSNHMPLYTIFDLEGGWYPEFDY